MQNSKKNGIHNNVNIREIKNRLEILDIIFKVTKSDKVLEEYKRCKKELIDYIKKTKREFNEALINNSENKTKKETVKKKIITPNNGNAETFNNYFSSVAQQMSGNVAGNKAEALKLLKQINTKK
ncbi:hypothetical protein WA026_018145, partial [Henosepilachna vigintioctopunctata]